jgi:hypothetical protein
MTTLTKDQIREIFMAHGFTIKEGQTDLKQYVYDAALALLSASKPAALHQPTEAMLNAARDWSLKKYGLGIGSDAAIGCWQAMLAAAPAQSGEAVEADVVPNEIAELLTEPCWNLSRRDVSDLLKRIGSILYAAPQPFQPSAVVLDDERAALWIMQKAFRVTETEGDPDPDKQRFHMRFTFRSMEELHAADDQWRAFVAQPVAQTERALTVTPAMVKAAMPWLTGLNHMRRADKESHVEEAIKAALVSAQQASGGNRE